MLQRRDKWLVYEPAGAESGSPLGVEVPCLTWSGASDVVVGMFTTTAVGPGGGAAACTWSSNTEQPQLQF